MYQIIFRISLFFIALLLESSQLLAIEPSHIKPIAFYNINKDFKSFISRGVIKGDTNDSNIKFADINNDHLPDALIMTHHKEKYTIALQYNTGKGFREKHLIVDENNTRYISGQWHTDIIDINNDHLPDIVQTYIGENGHLVLVRRNTGSGFEAEKIWFQDKDSKLKYFQISFIDMDNDGLLDMLQIYRYKCGHRLYVRHNTGKNFGEQKEWLNDSRFRYLSDTWSMDIVDVNADGLPDVINKSIGDDGHHVYVMLNNGSKLQTEKLWYKDKHSNLQYWKILFIDMNGDGWLDMVQVYAHQEGHMISIGYNSVNRFLKTKAFLYDQNERYQTGTWYLDLVDIDGDGLVDVVNTSIDKGGYQVYRRSNHGKELGSEKLWFSDMQSDLEDWKILFIDLTHNKIKDIIQLKRVN